MFQSQEQLINAGARDFVYINVVPFDRSPDGKIWLAVLALTAGGASPNLGPRISQWNTALPGYAADFANRHPKISVAVYDLHTLFTTVLDSPQKYGFKDATSGCHTSDCIWVDEGPHSTYGMHKIIAADMAHFLGNPTPTISTNPTAQSAAVTLLSFNLPLMGLALVASGLFVGVGTVRML